MANMKMSRTWRGIATYLTLASMTVFSVMPGQLLAGPVGEQVEAGSAEFTRNGNQTIIDVSTQNAVINYQSFNIGAQEYVRFNQLNSASRVLNRINGGSPTHIDGHLSANGQVFFVNPAGVMFGQSAIVDVAGIYAAAGNMATSDFLNGTNRFSDLTGEVANYGTINSQFVALVGKRVVNDGIIFAPGGVVTMVAGDEVVISEKNGTIMVKVDGGDADSTDAAVVNTGSIDTGETGQVALGAGDMYWLGVKQEESGSVKGGQIAVDAEGSSVEISGTIDAAEEARILADEIAFYTVGIGSGNVTLTGNQVTVGNIAGAGGVAVLGTPRDDLHILDFGYGDALPGGGLSFDAGSQENPKPLGDSLLVRGGSFDTVGITFTDSTPDGFSGELTYDGYSVGFAGFEPLTNTGTAANIVYTLPAGGNPDAVLGDDGTPNDDISQIDGSTFELTSFTNPTTSLTINLGGGGDTITLDALDSQFVADLTITGGAGADSIIVNAITGAGTYTFDGAGGSDTLTGPAGGAAFAITGANAGTLDGDTFSNIENLVGAAGGDSFTFTNAGSLTGSVDGGGGTNILTGDDDGNAFAITGADSGTLTGKTSGWSNFENLVGGSSADTFTFSGGTVSGIADGAGGSDTIVADATDNTFTIDGANEGNLDGNNFDSIENLEAGDGDDTFDIRDGGSIVSIDGQGHTTADILTYASRTGPISIDLSDDSATGVAAGGLNNIESVIGSADTGDQVTGDDVVTNWDITAADTFTTGTTEFSAIENIQGGSDVDTFSIAGAMTGDLLGGTGADVFELAGGSANLLDGEGGTGDTLEAPNSATTFNITGANAGDVGGTQNWQGIENLTGGTAADDFVFAAGGSIAGTADGGLGGTDTLDYDASTFGSDVAINLQTSAATGTGGFANIDAFTGDAGQTNSITGTNANTDWTITGADTGNVTGGPTFTNFANVTGGSMDDAFTVDFGGSLSGTLSGGSGGTDSATFDGDGNANAFDINAAVANTVDVDTNSTLLANIDAVTANGLAGDDSFVVAPATAYTVTVDAGAEGTADTFDLDTTPLSDSPTFTPTGDGAATFSFPDDPTFMDVDYADVETLTMSGPHATFDIAVLLDTFGDDLTIQLNAAGTLLEFNGSTISQAFGATLFESLTVTGNGNDNTLTVNETAGGLPGFGGTADGSHTNAAFTGSTPNPANVGLHFDGAGGSDDLALNFTTNQTVNYFADDDATANSGLINVNTAFSMSFEGLAPVTMTGTGGTLNINTTANTLADDFVLTNAANIGFNLFREDPDDGGFEAVTFGGFDAVDITVGNGSANSVGIGTPGSLDTAPVNGTALTQIDVTGGPEITTINVEQLPATMTLNIAGGGAADVINITPVGQSLAAIAGAITIDGGLGDDVLNIDDSATTGDTTGTIDDSTITGFGMPNGITNYTSILTLNFTTADAAGQSDSVAINGSGFTNLNLDMAAGDDDVTVNLDSFLSTGQTLSLFGGAGTDALVVNDTGGNDTFIFQSTTFNAAPAAELDRNTNQQSIVYDRDGDADDSFEVLGLIADGGTDQIRINNNFGFGITQVSDSVNLLTTAGSILDTNDGGAVTDIQSTQTDLRAGADITLETDVDGLTAVSNVAGNVTIDEVDGLTALNASAASGNVTLTAAGAITDADADTDLAGATVTVTNTTGGMGALANPIETAATNLNVDNQAGDIFLTEVDSLTSLIVDAGTNDLHFLAQSGTINQAGTDDIVADEMSLTGTGNFALDGDGNDVNELAATVTGNVTYVNALDAGPVAIDVVTGGETGVSLSGALDVTADGIVVNENISAVGVTLTGRSDDAVATDADTLIDINAVTIDAGAGALTITGEDVAIDGATLDGTGALALQPVDVEDNIELGDADADDPTDEMFQLDDAEIATFSDGFSGITIGRADGSHNIDVNSVTFTDPITIQSPVDGLSTETISIIGTLAGTGNASVTILGAQGTTVFDSSNPSITTEGQSVLIDDAVVVADGQSGLIDTTLNGNSAGAAIAITGTLDGSGASTDGPTFADGDEERLITDSGSAGSLSLLGDVGVGADLILDLTGDTLNLGTGIAVDLGNTTESAFNFNSINFNGATISGTGVIQFAPAQIDGNIAINSDTPDAITFDLDNTTVTTADDVTFADGFGLIIFGQSSGTGLIEVAELDNVTFTDSVHFLMDGSGGRIDVGNPSVARTLTSTANAVDGDDTEFIGFEDESDVAYTFTGPGNTTTIMVTDVTTAGLALVYNDAVILDSPTNNVRMDTTNAGAVATGANITFNGTLNADSAGNQSLELFSGTDGDILFGGAVGANNRLGDVFIGEGSGGVDQFDFNSVTATNQFIASSLSIQQFDNDGGNVQFDQGINTAGFSGSPAGGDVLINTDADADNDAGGDVIVSDTINTSALLVTGVAGADAGDVTITGKDVTLNNITATGGQTDTATGGAGGTVIVDAIDADPANITLVGSATPFEINTAGGTGPTDGAGGDVTLGDASTPGGSMDVIRITTDDYGISTGDTAGNITFDGFVDGAGSNDLILTAGTQAVAPGASDIIFNENVFDLDLLQVNSAFDVTFNESVGYDAADVADAINNIDITANNDVLFGNAVGDGDQVLVTQQLRIRSANEVTSNAPVIAGSILQDTGAGATTFNEAVTTNNASGISIATERAEFGDTLGDDTVTVNAAGNVVIAIDGTDTANVTPTNTLVINDNAPFVLNGGGSFTQQGAGTNLSVVELGADITTQGGGITFRDHVEANQNVILSTGAAVGGNILFDQNLFALTDTTETVTLTAGSGNISVNGAVGTDPTAAQQRLGQLLINNANITTFADTVDVMDFTQLTGTGQTEFQGDVTVFQDFTNADVIDSNAIDQTSTGFFVRTSGNLFFNAADLAVLEVTGGVGGANVVMQVGNADFTAGNNTIGIQTAGGTPAGVLVLEPFAQGGDLNAGTGSGGIALSNNDVNALADGAHATLGGDFGFSRIFLGRSDGTGSISLNNGVTFHAPLYVRASEDAGSPNIGNITIGGSGGVVLTEDGHEIVFDAHEINLGGSVTTNNGDIYFVSGGSRDNTGDFIPDPTAWLGDDVNGASATDGLANVTLVGNSSLDSTGGDITFENDIDGDGNPGDFNLTLDAGGVADGNIAVGATDDGAGTAVTGRVGGTDRIGTIEIVDAANVTFGGDGTGSNSDAGTGSIDATAFRQLAGSGNTTLFGTTAFDGVETALRTGGYANPSIDGGDVEVAIDGDFLAAGAIITRGGNRSTPGDGRNGGAVQIGADTIEVQRIDSRGSTAFSSGDGGNAGAITLDASTVTLHGDLLATGGTPLGGRTGSAADVELGSDPLTHAIVIDPVAPGAHGQTVRDDTIVIQGNDVIFDGTVDAGSAGQSLFVDTFANFTQSPVWGLTEFNANVGDSTPLQLLRTDTNVDLKIADGALAARTPTQVNDTTATNHLIGGFTVIDAASVEVTDEMTFQDGVILDAADVTLTATDTAGTVRFNNTLHSQNGENNDLTLEAVTTIFNDRGNVGQGFVGTDAGGVDAHVGSTDSAFDTSLGALRNPLDTAESLDLNPLGVLVTTDSAGPDTTFINTAFMGLSDGQFNDAVEVASDSTLHATGSDAVAAIGNKTIVFESTVDSSNAEFNDLLLITTGVGTTRFNGEVGNRADTGVFSNALGHLQTDLTGDADTDTGVADGITEINTSVVRTNGASQLYNDPVVVFMDVLFAEGAAGDITFNHFLDSDTGVGLPFDVTVNTAGATIFRSEVGLDPDLALSHLGTLITDAPGTTEIHADLIALDATFNDAVLIGVDANAGNVVGTDSFSHTANDALVTIGEDVTTNSVTFVSTVDSIAGQTSDLTVVSDTTQFMQDVGSTTPLGTVTTTLGAGGTEDTILGDNADADDAEIINFEADQFIFEEDVIIEDNVVITGNETGDGSDSATIAIDFQEDLNADGTLPARNLTLITTDGGLTRIGDASGDAVGNNFAINTLLVDNYNLATGGNGTTLINAGSFTVDAEATFNDAVAIGEDVTMTAGLVSGTIRFNNTLNGEVADGNDANDLTLNANSVIFDDDGASGIGVQDADTAANDAIDATVGQAIRLDALTVDGTLGGGGETTTINTTLMDGNQFIFNDNVIVATDDPTQASGLNAGSGAVVIESFLADADGNPAFVFANDAIQFNANLDSSTSEFNEVHLNTNNVGVSRLGDAAGDFVGSSATARLGRLVTNADGQTHVVAGNVNTQGATTIHNDPVVLFSDVTYHEFGPGDVIFNNTVDSDLTPRDLFVFTDVGDNEFHGIVGGARALNNLFTDTHVAPNATSGITLIDTTAITVIEETTFQDAVVINDQGVPTVITATDTAGTPGSGDLGTIRFNNTLNSSDLVTPGTSDFADLTLDASVVVFDDNGATGQDFQNLGDQTEGSGVDAVVGGDNAFGTLLIDGAVDDGTERTYINVSGGGVHMQANLLQFNDPTVIANEDNPSGLTTLQGLNGTSMDAVVFDSTLISDTGEFNDLLVNTPNGGDTRFNAPVGAGADGTADSTTVADGTELGNVTTDAPGTTFINIGSAHFQVNGNLVHHDAVVLEMPAIVTSFTGDVTYNDTLDSEATEENDATFFLRGGDGDLTFNAIVGDSDGDDDTTNTRLGDVLINDVDDVLAVALFKAASVTQEGVGPGTTGGSGNTTFRGMVDTSGSASTGAPGNLNSINGAGAAGDGGDIFILTDGDITFFGGANLNSDAGAAGMFRAQPDADSLTGGGGPATIGGASPFAPENRLALNGMFTAIGGTSDGVFLLSPNGRTGKSAMATIRGAFMGEPGVVGMPTISINGASIYIGVNEVFTAPAGSIALIATDLAGTSTFNDPLVVDPVNGADENPDDANIIHNDMAALGDIAVTAEDIRFRLRPEGPVISASTGVPDTDLGLDIIAGGDIPYSSVPQALTGYTTGPGAIFANPGADFDTTFNLAGFVQTDFDPVNTFQLTDNANVSGFGATAALDPSSNGPSNANAAEALAAVIPTPEQSGDVLRETIVGDYQRELLAEFAGVDLEGLTPAQRLEFLTGRELYNDLPGVSPVKVAVARALLTENRLLYDPVADMLGFYRDFFLEEVVNRETGQVELISRHIEHRRALASAYDAYQQRNDQFTAAGFAGFLLESPDHGDAYRAIQGMKTLTAKFEMIGLTPLENSEAMLAVAQRIAPEGMTAEQVMAVTRAMPAADDTLEEPEMPEVSTNGTDGETEADE